MHNKNLFFVRHQTKHFLFTSEQLINLLLCGLAGKCSDALSETQVNAS